MAQQVDEWTPKVLNALERSLGLQANRLIEVMKETGAILAGGFVLQSIVKYYDERLQYDLDIYVPYQNVRKFLEKCIVQTNPDGSLIRKKDRILQDFINSYRRYDASIYCRSFLRKNGIRRVHTFSNITRIDFTEPKLLFSVDIMSVRKRRTPVEVCSNFDLTFCQVWFNGTTVFATHPEHIRQKAGFLQGDYIQALLSGNEFLKTRIKKYKRRGFKITYDPSVTKHSIPSIDEILGNNICLEEKPIEERLPIWFQRIATKWLLMNKKQQSSFYIPLQNKPHGNLQLFLDSTTEVQSSIDKGIIEGAISISDEIPYEIPEDEGYDSEDMDGPKLAQLAVEKYVSKEKELSPVPIQPDIVLYRSLFLLLEKQFSKHKKNNNFTDKIYEDYNLEDKYSKDSFYDVYNNFRFMYQYEYRPEIIAKLYKQVKVFGDYLLDHCTTEGDDFYGGTGRLYHIHNHPIDQGITSESLEGYLEEFKQLADTTKGIPCYYRPECEQLISLRTIETIVSPGYFKNFAKRGSPKMGIDTILPIYDATLSNTKIYAEGFGDEYSETMCPFCLQPISRNAGCNYMTHDNINKLPESAIPYCDKNLVAQSILDSYKRKGRDLLEHPDLPLHIEICVECGRPCSGHQHFDINSEEPALLPDNHDYSKCSGGGRPELFARIMAVRDVYKYGGIKDPKQERLVAAWAADAAARDPVYLARGAALAAKEPDQRAFNVKVPAIKKYKSKAYKDVSKNKANAATKEAKNSMANVSEAPSKTAAWVKVWVDAISAVKIFDEDLARQTAEQARETAEKTPAEEFNIPDTSVNDMADTPENDTHVNNKNYLSYSEDGKSLLDKFIETGISEAEAELEPELEPELESDYENNLSVENKNIASPINFEGGNRKKSRKNRNKKITKNIPSSINYKQDTNTRRKRKLRIKTRRNTIPM